VYLDISEARCFRVYVVNSDAYSRNNKKGPLQAGLLSSSWELLASDPLDHG
jgi:hypothetical protein